MLRWGRIIPEDLCRAFTENPYKLLILLVLADLVFIVLHIVSDHNSLLNHRKFSLSIELSFPEMYQYIKEFWITLLLLFFALRTRSVYMLVWGILFSYLLIDDSFRTHERMGRYVYDFCSFNQSFDLLTADHGQFCWAIIIGFFFAVLIGAFYIMSKGAIRSISKSLIALIVLLVFFGVLIDSVQALHHKRGLYQILDIVEEGGEMIVMSVIAWYVFYLEPDGVRKGLEPKLS